MCWISSRGQFIRGGRPAWGFVEGLTTHLKKNGLLRNVTQDLGIGRLLWTRQWTLGFHKRRGISWLAEWLLASQEGLRPMKLGAMSNLPRKEIFRCKEWNKLLKISIVFNQMYQIYTFFKVRNYVVFSIKVSWGQTQPLRKIKICGMNLFFADFIVLELSQKCKALRDLFQDIKMLFFFSETFCNFPEFNSTFWLHQSLCSQRL
jgi:hypothetical protein